MAKIKGAIVVDIQRCKGCQICIPACANDVIKMSVSVNRKGFFYAEMVNGECIGCANCAIVCPDGAISVYRKKIEK